ncbi:hypothetical protein BALOs_0287 [Halobacteriovorax sp. BALOs_7]|uniref:hypothetical protein n=1 Tax=unclassified Halobacteriovorax TaxID=2639665 RepID=UPI000EA1D9C8|nr:hypothetical protein [Halobacteriovorax sp. BALOs_7]AYF43302.1 hypothetical protein BALOs_0287 [Halobacteriovorax sp. BALOs_7]
MKNIFFTVIIGALSLVSETAYADGRGEISLNYRYYTQKKYTDVLLGNEKQPTDLKFVKLSLEERDDWKGWEYNLSLVARADEKYQENSYVDFNELNIGRSLGNWQFSAGYHMFMWSRLEAYHVVDVLNSRINDGNIERFEKLGEKSIVASHYTSIGTMKFIYMPYFTEGFYPDPLMRIFDGLEPVRQNVVSGNEVKSSDEEDQYNQFAVYYAHQFGDLDLTVFAMDHIDRTRPIFGARPSTPTTLEAFYVDVLDIGAAATFFWGEQTFKFEYLYSDFNADDSVAILDYTGGTREVFDYQLASIGHEYTHNYANNWSSSFYTEYQYVLGVGKEKRSQAQIFQNDLFIGHRFALNDAYSNEFTLGLYIDLERNGEALYYLSYERRLNNAWKAKVNFRGVTIGDDAESDRRGLYILDGDDELGVTLTRFF